MLDLQLDPADCLHYTHGAVFSLDKRMERADWTDGAAIKASANVNMNKLCTFKTNPIDHKYHPDIPTLPSIIYKLLHTTGTSCILDTFIVNLSDKLHKRKQRYSIFECLRFCFELE